MTSVNKVRKDLRQLKITAHAVSSLEKAFTTHEKRIKMLERLGNGEKEKALIENERKKLEHLNFLEKIKELTELELAYKDLIYALPPLEMSIMVDCFFNGKSYWQIGLSLGFTEEGIRKKVGTIIKTLAKAVS